MSLTNTQTRSLVTFAKRSTAVEIVAGSILAISGLILFVYGRDVRFNGLWQVGLAFVVCSGLYPLVLVLVMRQRTGLVWHFINAQPNLYTEMLLPFGYLIVIFLLWSGTPSYVMFAILFVGIMLIATAQSRLKRASERQAWSERERYGDHWHKLALLSFWDILFLRIPHERA